MAKLAPADLNSTPELAAVAKQIEASRGWVSNLMRTTAHSPDGVLALMAHGHYLRFKTELTEMQRELVICATVRSVPYAWIHHSGLLRQLGLDDTQLAVLKDGGVPERLSPSDRALCAFVFAFAVYKGVAESLATEAKQHFSDRQIMDAALLSAFYIGAGSIVTAFEVEIEPPEVLQLELDWQEGRPH